MRFGTFYRAALLRHLGLTNVRGRVLDVGGYDGFWLSHLGAENAVSLDTEVVHGYPSVTYLQGDGQTLPLRDETFDVVFALEVIEHVADEEPFVAELMRVLKPGGTLYLSTPHQEIRIFPRVLTPWANRRWQHYRTTGYTPEAIRSLFASWGPQSLQIRQLKTWCLRTFYLPLSLVWRLGRWPAEALTRWFAALDSGQAEAPGGYLLAEIVK